MTMKNTFYVGSYAETTMNGIHFCEIDLETGELKLIGGTSEILNPSYTCISEDKKYLYAVSEDREAGEVFAYEIAGNELKYINKMPTSGNCPCHLMRYQDLLIVSNYMGGSASVYRIGEKGEIKELLQHIQHEGSSINPERQTQAYMHCAYAKNGMIYMADLGCDTITEYSVGENGLTETAVIAAPAGVGPRHILSLDKFSDLIYVICEITADILVVNIKTKIVEQIISSLPHGFSGANNAAALRFSDCGKFLYASNRGHDSVTAFAVDDETGHLTKICTENVSGGVCPRDFEIFGEWIVCANQDFGGLTVLKRDPNHGTLTQCEQKLDLHRPVSIIKF
ncbi:MAG: lactonase family protein [Clostridiales bacterium]|nr:lactonase family protein [Clostridiales bacterium]